MNECVYMISLEKYFSRGSQVNVNCTSFYQFVSVSRSLCIFRIPALPTYIIDRDMYYIFKNLALSDPFFHE